MMDVDTNANQYYMWHGVSLILMLLPSLLIEEWLLVLIVGDFL